MKRIVGRFIISLYKTFLNLCLILQVLKPKAVSITVVRIVAVILITTLLTPVFLLNPIRQTQAQSRPNLSAQPAIPNSAPPESFIISDNNSLSSSVTSAFGSLLSFSSKTITGFFENPKVPGGVGTAGTTAYFG